jgi:hypothetical protein
LCFSPLLERGEISLHLGKIPELADEEAFPAAQLCIQHQITKRYSYKTPH